MNPDRFSRREWLGMALAVPGSLRGAAFFLQNPGRQLPDPSYKDASYRVVVEGENARPDQFSLVREWNGTICRSRLINNGREPARVRRVVLFDLQLSVPPQAALYGEGFQMLSQTGGTLGQPVDYSQYTDDKHYRIPAQGRAFYGLLTLSPAGADTTLFAFTSCARFVGSFEVEGASLRVIQDLEGIEFAPGEAIQLEEFMHATGANRTRLLSDVAERLAQH